MNRLSDAGMIIFAATLVLLLGAFYGREFTLIQYDQSVKKLHSRLDIPCVREALYEHHAGD
jgi:hypothetical protein